nr:cysteine synthase A [Veillonella denticariosi]
MSNIAKSFVELIGKTPLLAATRFGKTVGAESNIFAKLEYFNPGGSVKDRIAAAIIQAAVESGELQPGGTIVEATSGNTGIGLSAVGAALGYKVVIVMPETMSIERRKLMLGYGGAQLVLTDGSLGMKGAIAKAKEIVTATAGGAIEAGQFVNQANPAVHYKTTGPEIWQDTDGAVDIYVAGVGTGGTLTGAGGRYLKEQNPGVKVVAVEPADSAVLSNGKPGPHKIQGLGAGFIPDILDTHIYDEVIQVANDDAFKTAQAFGHTEGVLVGISSGAALWAAQELAKRPENKGKNIVVILPDTGGERYLSTPLFPEA